MRALRTFGRTCGLVVLMGFVSITVVHHTHHDAHDAPPAQHCGALCCPAHSIVPVRDHTTTMTPQTTASVFAITAIVIPHLIIAQAIFRPPIAAVVL